MHPRYRSIKKGGTKTDQVLRIDWSGTPAVDAGSPKVGGLPDGTFFGPSNLMRSSTEYNPYGLTMATFAGKNRAKIVVEPIARVGEDYPNDFRFEISKGWQGVNRLAPGYERWTGLCYHFPNADELSAEVNAACVDEISLYQDHPGSLFEGSDPPLQQIALAGVGQLSHVSDPYRQTPLGGEVMIIQKDGDPDITKRYTFPGKRVIPGVTKRLKVITYTRYGAGAAGIFKAWIGIDNGTADLFTHPSYSDHTGPTIYAAPNDFSGTLKYGPYHLGFKNNPAANVSAGHTKFTCLLGDIFEKIIAPTDYNYGADFKNLVDPDNYSNS